jgi:ferredoxin
MCKYTDCITACPVDCFHEGPNFLVINPHDCIDCGLCIDECPILAIKPDHQLDSNETIFLELNAELSNSWPIIYAKKEALENADDMAKTYNKIDLLIK